ncbi:hypothetical protein GOBAR_AA14127 [Gossypium barbadense]|uniref:Uncharacterized protein n=1 Tax=Gossypium barbadense TaxID=3634 RepID=A0A2P5XT38_GOSBA|nr:hypothetical protein GOBAR_AA14127 [Gossypium barbadense]
MLETHFQNTETTLKNQQASIQGLETQIGQLSKLISERPQGILPSNTEPNPREHLNAISTQDKEGFIVPEPELMQEIVVSKGKSEMPNAMKFLKELLVNKRKLDEVSHVELNAVCSTILQNKLPFKLKDPGSFTIPYLIGELTLRVGDEMITFQARNSGITLNIEDAADPYIVPTTPNEEIPLTVLSIFPFGTVEVSHPKFGTFKHTQPGTRACLKSWPNRERDTVVRYGRVEAIHDFPKTQDVINPHGRVTWPWGNLIGDHGRANGKTRACQGQGLIFFCNTGWRHAHAIKLWT